MHCTEPKIVNTTPHPINVWSPDWCALYRQGECDYRGGCCKYCHYWEEARPEVIQPCGVLINAAVTEEEAGVHPSGARLVRTVFKPDTKSLEVLAELEAANPGAVIVGSIIAAQAFPGRVFALCPAPGYERVAPDKKRMLPDKFTVF